MAIDYGDRRIGVAKSDNSRLIASPLMTLDDAQSLEQISFRIKEIAQANFVTVIYVGLPLHLSGSQGSSSDKARAFAGVLLQTMPEGISVRLLDERLTTTSALQDLRRTGQKSSKENIDQLAAVKILEFALEIERTSGELAGHEVR